MENRGIPRLGRDVSVVGLGTWQLGADWGDVSTEDALSVLDAAYDSGVRLFDTADAYGDGSSEKVIGEFVQSRGYDDIVVATKIGRRVMPQRADIYTLDNFRAWVDRSRENLRVDTLDLVQLHCPPTSVYADDEVFDALDTLVDEGRIAAYGVSVETRAEALAAIARPRLATVQLVFNAFRQGPLTEVLPAASAAGVGLIARVPLASGLLSGKYDENTTFAADDHRTYNRDGSAFDIGETFAGVDFATGLEAVRRLAPLVPEGVTMAQFALRWVIDQVGISTVIPGARNAAQAHANAEAAAAAPLSAEVQADIAAVYAELIAPQIGDRW
ncbi:aldo/keto reductase [Microbacterium sp. HMWF026]|uniref:aldo/keto reductase n=1 Tax=Microbacterium sp. HMWF026 TaxID=2056861 RepID=UPI000D3D4487|nr:aldo/keto reductase [Microbacterium sp. HMWF026]PTT18738.1 aldo/keto reductase [Microbacterium sp. HMWF026]